MPDNLRDRLEQQLGRAYTIERELGGGGMSRVFVATETSLNRPVVIKLLPPELAALLSTDRFRQEIEVSARLQHPHIVPLLTAGEADGLLYYTMPLVEGESLRDRLSREEPLPVGETIRYLRDTADALAYAHDRGLVHRDIKPDNILITAGHAVVTDFGVAKAMSASAGPAGGGLTSVGVAIGTMMYMAPEQATADPNTDHRADLYAFGVMAYELLSGKTPFAGRSPASLIAAHAAEPVEPLERRRPDLPPALAALVMGCLEKDPARRPQTARDVVTGLDEVAVSLSGGRAGSRPIRVSPRLVVSGAVLVAVVAAAVFGLRRWQSRPPVDESISVITVVPPAAPSGDTALARIGRDLTMLLSVTLEGQGNLRLTDPQTTIAQLGGRTAALADARAIARKVGAGAFLYGALVRNGGRVRAELSLRRADTAVSLASISAETSPDSLSALTDSLAWSLLRQVWRGRDAPTPSIELITTRSWPALRAFLEGEAAFAEYRMRDAADAYRRAGEADTTFWLAWGRLSAVNLGYRGIDDTAVGRRARVSLDRLPERERRWAMVGRLPRESLLVRSKPLRERELLRDYPDWWLGWWWLAERLFHHAGFVYGNSRDEAVAALRRTVELNPRFTPAWSHLAVGLFLRDSAGWREAATRAGEHNEEVLGFLVDTSQSAGWSDPTRTVVPGEDGLHDLVDRLASGEINWVHLVTSSPPQVGAAVVPLLLKRPELASPRLWLEWGAAALWASRGAWDSSLASLASVQGDDPYTALIGYQLAVVGAWLGGVPFDSVPQWKERALGVKEKLTSEQRAEVAWLDGLLAATKKDPAGISAAREAVLEADSAKGLLLARALATFEALGREQYRPAADSLAAVEWDRPWLPGSFDGAASWISLPVHRLIASRALAAAGDTVEAIRLLNWVDDWWPHLAELPLVPYTLLERARLLEGRGDTLNARLDYEDLLRRFDRPVASLKWVRDEAERRYALLGRPKEQQEN